MILFFSDKENFIIYLSLILLLVLFGFFPTELVPFALVRLIFLLLFLFDLFTIVKNNLLLILIFFIISLSKDAILFYL